MSAILWWPEIYRAFDLSVPVSVGVGVSGSASGPADFGLEVPVGVGMSAAAIGSGEFDLAVPVSLGMRGPVSADLSVPVSVGMAGTEEYSVATDLSVPISIGATGVLSGGPFSLEVPVNIGMAGRLRFSDDFNRPNSTTSLGGVWAQKLGTMGISANAAYPVSAGNCFAMYPEPLTSNDMEVSMVVGLAAGDVLTTEFPSYVVLGADENVGAAAWLRVARNSANVSLYTVGSWAGSGAVIRANIPHGGISTGDEFTLRRIGDVYTVLKNGNQIGQPWIDEDDVLPRGQDHLHVGMGGWGGTAFQRIDSWVAQEI